MRNIEGYRPEVMRKDLVQRLEGYGFTEIDHALEILAESDSDVLVLDDVRRVWDRVSVSIDHHLSKDYGLADLRVLEKELAEAGRFGTE